MLIRITSISLLLIIIVSFSGCSSDLFNQTPKCSDISVVNTLKSLLDSDSRKVTIDIDMIRQTALDEQTGMRTCQTNVDYAYTVDKESGFIKQAVDTFKVGMNNDGSSKNNKINYTVILGETGKKYIVTLIR